MTTEANRRWRVCGAVLLAAFALLLYQPPVTAETLALRERSTDVRPGALDSPRSRAEVSLPLFDDASYVARLRQSSQSGEGRRVWTGSVEGYPESHVTLVVRRGRLAGRVAVDGRTFEILPNGRRSLVRELDLQHQEGTDCLELAPPRSRDAVANRSRQVGALSQGMETDGAGNTELDLIVFYTNAAKLAAGGREAILGLIDIGVEDTNAAFEDSRIKARFRLLEAQQIKYKESIDMGEDLLLLSLDDDGKMNKAHTRRDKLGADYVALIVDEVDERYCGIAWVLGDYPGDSEYAHSVTRYDCISNLTFAHELGHNLGLMHNREETNAPGWFDHSHGYHDPDGAFRTIMSYGTAPRVLNFSNPRKELNGVPMGVDKKEKDSADSTKSINATRRIQSEYRACVIDCDTDDETGAGPGPRPGADEPDTVDDPGRADEASAGVPTDRLPDRGERPGGRPPKR